MVPYKVLTQEQVLEAVAIMVAKSLPNEMAEKDYRVEVQFTEDGDYTVAVYLILEDKLAECPLPN